MKIPVAVEINEDFLKIATARIFVKQRQPSELLALPVAGLDDRKISESLAAALHQLKVKPSPLVLSLPRNQVTVRTLHLPAQDKNEISQMLSLHIGRIVPYKKEEIIFDYLTCGTDDLNYTKLMLAILHRDILKRYLKILEATGLTVDRVFLSSFGIWQRILAANKEDISARGDLYLALDVDSAYSDFIVFDREHLFFSRSIAANFKDGFQDSEVTKILGEVRQSLVLFRNEESNKVSLKIFISGSSLSERLVKAMGPEFDMAVKPVAAAYPGVLGGKKKESALPENISFTAVSEFALEDSDKRISFMLPEMQISKALKDRARELTKLGSLLIYLFAVSLLFLWGKVSNEQSYLRRVNEQNAAIEKDVGGLAHKYKLVKYAKDFVSRRKIVLAVLGELQRITPPDIAIDALEIDNKGGVTLKGRGDQPSKVFKYVGIIGESKYFKGAVANSIRTKKTDGKEVTNFEIKFAIGV